jgi:hypothetical protein
LELVTRKLPEESEKNHRKPESGQSMFRRELELSLLQAGTFMARVNLLEHVTQKSIAQGRFWGPAKLKSFSTVLDYLEVASLH